LKVIALFLAVAVSGCVDTLPPAPSAAQQKLQAACDGGDTSACKAILDKEERENAAYNARVQSALSGIGQQSDPLSTYAMMTSQPQQAPVLTPLTVNPVMMTCWPYGQVPAPGPCPK